MGIAKIFYGIKKVHVALDFRAALTVSIRISDIIKLIIRFICVSVMNASLSTCSLFGMIH